MPQLQRYSPTKLCDGAQMAIFGDFFASCIFSEPRAARFRPTSYIRTKASMADIQSATAEIRQGKKRRRKKTPQDENIMVCPIPYGDHN